MTEKYVDFLTPTTRLKAIYKHGKELCINRLIIATAVEKERPENLRTLIGEIKNSIIPVLPVCGRDLSRMKIENSKIGTILDRLEQEWLDSNFTLTREELLARV